MICVNILQDDDSEKVKVLDTDSCWLLTLSNLVLERYIIDVA